MVFWNTLFCMGAHFFLSRFFRRHFDNNDLIRVAINLSYTYNNVKLKQEDEVAFFPPVSGG